VNELIGKLNPSLLSRAQSEVDTALLPKYLVRVPLKEISSELLRLFSPRHLFEIPIANVFDGSVEFDCPPSYIPGYKDNLLSHAADISHTPSNTFAIESQIVSGGKSLSNSLEISFNGNLTRYFSA